MGLFFVLQRADDQFTVEKIVSRRKSVQQKHAPVNHKFILAA
jgi:hypothetical protein